MKINRIVFLISPAVLLISALSLPAQDQNMTDTNSSPFIQTAGMMMEY